AATEGSILALPTPKYSSLPTQSWASAGRAASPAMLAVGAWTAGAWVAPDEAQPARAMASRRKISRRRVERRMVVWVTGDRAGSAGRPFAGKYPAVIRLFTFVKRQVGTGVRGRPIISLHPDGYTAH